MVVFATPQCFISLTIRHLSKTPRFQHHVSNQTNTNNTFPITMFPTNHQHQQHFSNTTSPTKQTLAPTTRLNHLTNSSNTTFPINQPTANTNNTFQTARFKHLYYTPRNAPSFRFQPPPSGTWFSAITPLPPVILLQLVLRTGKRVYRDQSLFVCSEISDEAIIV